VYQEHSEMIETQVPFAITAEAAGAFRFAHRRTSHRLKMVTVAAVVLLFTAAVLGLMLLGTSRWKAKVITSGASAQALVVEVHEDSGSKGDEDVVRLRSLRNATEEFEFTINPVRLDRYAVGQIVEVWYESGRTERIRTRWDSNETKDESRAGLSMTFAAFAATAAAGYAIFLRKQRVALERCDRAIRPTRTGWTGTGKNKVGFLKADDVVAVGRFVRKRHHLAGTWLFVGPKGFVLTGESGKQFQFRPLDHGRTDPLSITWDS
jgi:hypothetical protein